MKRMNNLKNVIAAKIMGGLIIGMTAAAGVAPVTVFAQSQEAECICDEKCSQDSINEECAVLPIYLRCEDEEKFGLYIGFKRASESLIRASMEANAFVVLDVST